VNPGQAHRDDGKDIPLDISKPFDLEMRIGSSKDSLLEIIY
jgi:hypothetical protein